MQGYSTILLIVVMIVAFYFLIIRPQRKRQQQQADMVKTLAPGTRVVTSTGIYATIVAMGEKQVVVETSPGARITILKQAIGRVVDDAEEDAELSGYRPAGAAVTADAPGTEDTSGDSGYAEDSGYADEDDDEQRGASGMAGGAPVQEYTPESGPDFTAPDQTERPGASGSHETSPWPTEGYEVSGTTGSGEPPADDTGTDGTDQPSGESDDRATGR